MRTATSPSWCSAPRSSTKTGLPSVPTTRTINNKSLSNSITLTASDVGALPDSTTIPTATSDLTNDSNFTSFSAVVSKTQPTGQTVGDLWLKVIDS